MSECFTLGSGSRPAGGALLVGCLLRLVAVAMINHADSRYHDRPRTQATFIFTFHFSCSESRLAQRAGPLTHPLICTGAQARHQPFLWGSQVLSSGREWGSVLELRREHSVACPPRPVSVCLSVGHLSAF